MRQWRAANPSKARAAYRRSNQRRYLKNPNYFKKRAALWAKNNPEKRRIIMERHHTKHRDEECVYARRAWLGAKLDAITAFGGKCRCCFTNVIEFLTFDHIHVGGGIDRKQGLKGMKWYKHLAKSADSGLYQLLCYNCHMAKDYYGACIHGRA